MPACLATRRTAPFFFLFLSTTFRRWRPPVARWMIIFQFIPNQHHRVLRNDKRCCWCCCYFAGQPADAIQFEIALRLHRRANKTKQKPNGGKHVSHSIQHMQAPHADAIFVGSFVGLECKLIHPVSFHSGDAAMQRELGNNKVAH